MAVWMKVVTNERTKRLEYFCKAGHSVEREDESCPICDQNKLKQS